MMSSKKKIGIDEAVTILYKAMKENGIDPTIGLTDSLFHFVSTCTPICNVDLFVIDKDNRVLFSWRDDINHGAGWHIPGGCIRMKETIDSRIQKTALLEIGEEVNYDHNPILVSENIITYDRKNVENQLVRAHGISFMYKCTLPDGFVVDNGDKKMYDAGYLKWFDRIPENLLHVHREIYYDFLKDWFVHS